MSSHARQATPRRFSTRVTATALGAAAIALTAAIVPTSAYATKNDPKVIVSGGAGCNTQPADLATYVTFTMNNGETASSPFFTNSVFPNLSYYKVTFNAVPVGGTSGYAVVTCTNYKTGASYQWVRSVSVNRPNFGENLSMNLKSG